MIFIIGGKGLTGSALVRYMEQENIEFSIIQKENKNEFLGKECDILIYANGNALKYKANSDPYFDFNASVNSIAEYIHGIDFQKFILISSMDVYDTKDNLSSTKEDVKINSLKLTPYGYHKFLVEEYVKHFGKNYLIFRLPGIIGPGLKKNVVYDASHSEKKIMISEKSVHNIINTDFVAKVIFKILELGIKNEIFNIASKNSISIKKIIELSGQTSEFTPESKDKIEHYEVNTEKISKYVDLTTSEEAIEEYLEYLKTE